MIVCVRQVWLPFLVLVVSNNIVCAVTKTWLKDIYSVCIAGLSVGGYVFKSSASQSSRQSTPRFTKSLSFLLIRVVLTEIQPFKNVQITKKCLVIRTQRPDGHTFLCKFQGL